MSSILLDSLQLRAETPSDATALELLHARTFGPGRFARTAFRLREGKSPRYDLSLVAEIEGEMVGAVRLTDILIGGTHAVLLGPLCADPGLQSKGIGRALMTRAVELSRDAGEAAILLVGDLAYYQQFGFERCSNIELPGPVDPSRLLICPLADELPSGRVA